MNKEDINRLKKSRIIVIIISIVLLIFDTFLSFFIIDKNSKKDTMDKQANITKFDENKIESKTDDNYYKPTFYYYVDGKEYACESTVSTPIEPTNDIIVYYNSNNPKECISSYEIQDVNSLLLGILIIFIIILLISIINIITISLKIKKKEIERK